MRNELFNLFDFNRFTQTDFAGLFAIYQHVVWVIITLSDPSPNVTRFVVINTTCHVSNVKECINTSQFSLSALTVRFICLNSSQEEPQTRSEKHVTVLASTTVALIFTGRLWGRKLIRPPKRSQITSPISDV